MAWSMGLLGASISAPAAVYELLETEILTSQVSSLNFINLVSKYGSDYTNLQLRMTHRAGGNTNSDNVNLKFNGASSGYALHYMYNVAPNVNAGGSGTQPYIIVGRLTGNQSNANIFGATVADILDPFDTSKNTTVRSLSTALDQSNRTIWLFSGAYFSTSAIDSISLTSGASNFDVGCRFSIYGQRSA